jgi:hypothetical protein
MVQVVLLTIHTTFEVCDRLLINVKSFFKTVEKFLMVSDICGGLTDTACLVFFCRFHLNFRVIIHRTLVKLF